MSENSKFIDLIKYYIQIRDNKQKVVDELKNNNSNSVLITRKEYLNELEIGIKDSIEEMMDYDPEIIFRAIEEMKEKEKNIFTDRINVYLEKQKYEYFYTDPGEHFKKKIQRINDRYDREKARKKKRQEERRAFKKYLNDNTPKKEDR